MTDTLRVFKIRTSLDSKGFRVEVRECTDTERFSVGLNRDAMAVTITALDDKAVITLVVGSPVVGDWNEVKAARSAISFATEPSCHDDPLDREWVERYGEALSYGAVAHSILRDPDDN